MSMDYSFYGGKSNTPMVRYIECICWRYPMPVGIVWYRMLYRGTVLETLSSFVIEPMRRKGIRTLMHNELKNIEGVEKMITEIGTADGRAWMTATGWLQVGNHWEFNNAKIN